MLMKSPEDRAGKLHERKWPYPGICHGRQRRDQLHAPAAGYDGAAEGQVQVAALRVAAGQQAFIELEVPAQVLLRTHLIQCGKNGPRVAPAAVIEYADTAAVSNLVIVTAGNANIGGQEFEPEYRILPGRAEAWEEALVADAGAAQSNRGRADGGALDDGAKKHRGVTPAEIGVRCRYPGSVRAEAALGETRLLIFIAPVVGKIKVGAGGKGRADSLQLLC